MFANSSRPNTGRQPFAAEVAPIPAMKLSTPTGRNFIGARWLLAWMERSGIRDLRYLDFGLRFIASRLV